MKYQKVIAPVFALLLVTSGIGGMVGTTVAAEQGNCSNLDDFVMFLTLGAVNGEDCSRQAYVEGAVEEMKQSDANQTEVDIYNAGAGLKSGHEAWAAPYDNYLSDTESVAWMKVESAVAESYEAGESESQANVAAREAVSDYYSVKQINLIEQWNQTVSQVDYLRQQAEMEDGISDDFVAWRAVPDSSYGYGGWDGVETETITLANGSTHDVKSLVLRNSNGADGVAMPVTPRNLDSEFNSTTVDEVYISPPNSNYNETVVLEPKKYSDRLNQTVSMNDNLQSEAENYVASTWSDFESGNINASEVISSHTAMFEYGVRSGNESESLYSSTAAIALGGFNVPNMSSTGTMNVTYNGVTYTGMVLAQDVPNGAWEVGKTYNTGNFDSPVFMATVEGEKIDFADSSDFTIEGMTSRDGNDIQSTETTEYVYQTADTSETLEMQEQLIDLREQIEHTEPINVGGGGSGENGNSLSIPDWMKDKYLNIPIWGWFIGLVGIATALSGRNN